MLGAFPFLFLLVVDMDIVRKSKTFFHYSVTGGGDVGKDLHRTWSSTNWHRRSRSSRLTRCSAIADFCSLGDVDKIRKAVIGGSLAPLLMFIAWNCVILGSVSKDAGLVAEAAGGVFDPLQVPSAITPPEKCNILQNECVFFSTM